MIIIYIIIVMQVTHHIAYLSLQNYQSTVVSVLLCRVTVGRERGRGRRRGGGKKIKLKQFQWNFSVHINFVQPLGPFKTSGINPRCLSSLVLCMESHLWAIVEQTAHDGSAGGGGIPRPAFQYTILCYC